LETHFGFGSPDASPVGDSLKSLFTYFKLSLLHLNYLYSNLVNLIFIMLFSARIRNYVVNFTIIYRIACENFCMAYPMQKILGPPVAYLGIFL
jgi:hypothetical protein